MSSPIHSYLFSPPASPPSRASSGKHRPPPLILTPQSPSLNLASPLSPNLITPHATSSTTATLTTELIPRSPRTPQNKFQFTLNDAYPTRTPRQGDIESTLYSAQNTPRVIVTHPTTPKRAASTTQTTILHAPAPIPSHSHAISIRNGLPKPVIRLLFFLTLIVSSIVLLIYIPSTRLPTLRDASRSRRLAHDQDGKAWLDLMNPVKSVREGLDRDYVPVKIKSSKMLKRGMDFFNGAVGQVEVLQAPLLVEAAVRTAIPEPTARPIPSSHELMAVRSYLLGSKFNSLPSTLNPSEPLDANMILGFKGKLENMLLDIEEEHSQEVVVWYGGDGIDQIPRELLELLPLIHGINHVPTLLPVHSRPDRQTLVNLFEKHNLPLATHPIIMIGNTPLIADMEVLKRDDGELRSLMKEIGWVESVKEVKVREKAWKPKFAVVKRKEVSEIERALEEVKK